MAANAVRAVLFDCDGVLVDSELISKNVLVDLSAELGANLDPLVALERFKGRRMAECMLDVERELGRPLPADFMQEFRKAEYEALAKEVKAIDGAESFIRSLEVPIYVASNGPAEKIRCTLGATGLDQLFGKNILSAYDVELFKPDPDLYLLAASRLGVDPEHCVVIEDSVPGATAGVTAGMRTIAYTPGVDKSAYPTEKIYFVDTMSQAADLVQGWNRG